jgi:hypothetical protein
MKTLYKTTFNLDGRANMEALFAVPDDLLQASIGTHVGWNLTGDDGGLSGGILTESIIAEWTVVSRDQDLIERMEAAKVIPVTAHPNIYPL